MYRMFNFPSKLAFGESIVNAPLVSLQIKNNAKSEVRFKQLIRVVIRGVFIIDSSTGNFNEHPILSYKEY
jgi:hypothetical protein